MTDRAGFFWRDPAVVIHLLGRIPETVFMREGLLDREDHR